MPYPIEEKLVIAVASSALFALDEADTVFRTKGVRAYREYQREHENDVLAPGIAFLHQICLYLSSVCSRS